MTISLVVVMASVAASQNPSLPQTSDTLSLKKLVISETENSLAHPMFLPPTRFSDLVRARDFPVSFLGYALVSEQPPPTKRTDFTWEMHLRSGNDDPYQSFRVVLGYAQAGGAAYLAYRHIKKYGFFR